MMTKEELNDAIRIIKLLELPNERELIEKIKKEAVTRRRTCAVCGNDFKTTNCNQICCGDACRIKYRRQKEAKKWQKRKIKRANQDVNINSAKAKAEGISYGHYMAREQSKEVKIDRGYD